MKRYLLLIILTLLLLTGCSSHYYRVKEGDLYIYLRRPHVKVVSFLASIDGYESHSAKRVNAGIWEVTVPENTKFQYFYIVDGNVFVPPCKLKEKDDFGSENCIYIPGL